MKKIFIFLDQFVFKLLFILLYYFKSNRENDFSDGNKDIRLKILIIKWYGLGDLILLTKTLNALKMEGCTIDLLTTDTMVFDTKHFPQIRKSVSISLNPLHLLPILSDLNKENYDIIFDAEQWSYFSAFLRLFIKAKNVFSFKTDPLMKHLGSRSIPYQRNIHESEQFFKFITLLYPGKYDDIKCSLNINSSNDEQKEILKKFELKEKEYIIIHPFTAHDALNFETERYIELSKDLIDKGNLIAFTGTEINVKRQNMISGLLDKKAIDSKQVALLFGKTSLEELLVLIKNAKCFIGQSTGVMHASSVLGTRTYCLTTQTNPIKWGVLEYNTDSRNILPHVSNPNYLYLFTKKTSYTKLYKKQTNFNDINELMT